MSKIKWSFITLIPSIIVAIYASTIATSLQAQELDKRILFAYNKCKYPIRFLVHHRDSEAPHHPHAWYNFNKSEATQLSDNGITLRHVVGQPLYIYAETIQKTGVPFLIWGGTAATASLNNVSYRLVQVPLAVNGRGELEFEVSCDFA